MDGGTGVGGRGREEEGEEGGGEGEGSSRVECVLPAAAGGGTIRCAWSAPALGDDD